MNKKEFEKLIISLVVKYDKALAFNDVEMTEYTSEIEDGQEYVYAEFEYQIDDRIDDNGGRDSNEVISKNIGEILGEDYGVVLDRTDTFINGYAAYTLTIDS